MNKGSTPEILERAFLEMLRRAATDLQLDIERAIRKAARTEAPGSAARAALEILASNIRMARADVRPMCQDTGTHSWWMMRPRDVPERDVRDAVVAATREATRLGYLRPNMVDPVTGSNSGDNTGLEHPVVHAHEWSRRSIVADVLLKGGGCENVSAQMALPDVSISAGRDLEGVRRAVLKMVHAAQGRGCAPGIIGVCIGGDRATGYAQAKRMLMRPLAARNEDRTLAKLERTLLDQCNQLDVGPMGYGGRTTLLGIMITKAHRLPASFFVTMAYSCWSLRRAHCRIAGRKVEFASESFAEQGV